MGRIWKFALAILLVAGATLAVVRWRSQKYDARELISLLPAQDATLGYIDTRSLRKAGILDLITGSPSAEEPDYQNFVNQTGFNYRTDLDALAAAFLNSGGRSRNYFVLHGRFDWKKLAGYAVSQGGACPSDVCSMPASAPGRSISFTLLRSTLLAIAVTPEPNGVSQIHANSAESAAALPTAPVWFWIPSLRTVAPNLAVVPLAVKFLAPLAQARDIVIAAEADGEQLRLRLNVTCASADDAKQMVQQLSSTATTLKESLGSIADSNSQQLFAIFAQGRFEQHNNDVNGTWPLERALLKKLTSGESR